MPPPNKQETISIEPLNQLLSDKHDPYVLLLQEQTRKIVMRKQDGGKETAMHHRCSVIEVSYFRQRTKVS